MHRQEEQDPAAIGVPMRLASHDARHLLCHGSLLFPRRPKCPMSLQIKNTIRLSHSSSVSVTPTQPPRTVAENLHTMADRIDVNAASLQPLLEFT